VIDPRQFADLDTFFKHVDQRFSETFTMMIRYHRDRSKKHQ
jgi:hypothetical protein